MAKRNSRWRKLGDHSVIEVDQNYQPMAEVSIRKAILRVASGCAMVLDMTTWERKYLHEVPSSSVLVIIFPRTRVVGNGHIRFGGQRGVLIRDEHECQYCGNRATTIDHLLPRSRGGPNTFSNLVACCLPCNQIKGNRTPSEAGMPLLRPAASPTAILHERFRRIAEEAVEDQDRSA